MIGELVVFAVIFGAIDTASSLAHCTKKFEDPFMKGVLICENVTDETVLYDEIQLLNDVPELIVNNSAFRFFVHGTFHRAAFEAILINNSNILGFTNFDVAFDGLQDYLIALVLVQCSFVDHLNWSQLQEMKKLVLLMVWESDLEYISDLSSLSSIPRLSQIDMSHNHVSEIHPNAFSQLRNLNVLMLSNNRIRSLTRSMFADPAEYLNLIDLSDNLLTKFPEDMFVNMPYLHALILDNNMFTTIDENTFRSVLSSLSYFHMRENPISCDCRLRWITKLHLESSKIDVICSSPPALKGQSLVYLENKDLWC